MALGYGLLYQPLESKITYLNRIMVMDEKSADSLRLNLHQKKGEINEKEAEKKKDKRSIRSMPMFLTTMNTLFAKHTIKVENLSPSTDGYLQLSFNLKIGYFKFIQFLADLELLNIVLERVSMYPLKDGKNPPDLSIKMVISARLDKPMANPERLATLKKKFSDPLAKDPFGKNGKGRSGFIVSDTMLDNNELTFKYLLSGIGRLANGDYVANINRRTYRVGDMLDDKIIKEIQKDQVTLLKKSKTGEKLYTLHFRKRIKKRDK